MRFPIVRMNVNGAIISLSQRIAFRLKTGFLAPIGRSGPDGFWLPKLEFIAIMPGKRRSDPNVKRKNIAHGIEVTSEMAAAGGRLIEDAYDAIDADRMAKRVFDAMIAVANDPNDGCR